MQKFCQSCAMPMKSDPQGGGAETDGGKSQKYCSYCYQNGRFTWNEGGVKDFQEHCRKIMVDNGCNRFLAWLFTRNFKRLERWK
ncbi:MAG: zinc ribbon domain-containing protein [Elusimicrobiota bacterium]|jgi:hypothetical protein|nr:zinc ribbon domain-containing protein [Elusimicrobiota bacterium]